MTNKTIELNFKNIVSELENKGLKLCFVKNIDMFIEDTQSNLYAKETYYVKSYLDKLIENETIVKFHLLDKSSSQNIEEWQKELWNASKVKQFIESQTSLNQL